MKKAVFILSLVFGIKSMAQTCFEIDQANPFHPMAPIITDTWCQESFKDKGKSFEFLYQVEEGVKPELSYLLEKNYKGKILHITHGSLHRGELNFQKTHVDDFNPLPFDYKEIESARRVYSVSASIDDVRKQNVLETLLFEEQNAVGVRNLYKVEEGTFSEDLDEDKKPFRAFWWPHDKLPMATGGNSPTETYDDLIPFLYSDWHPRSQDWERRYHALEHVPWGGHCNGWVASSILHKEPTEYLWDPYNKKVIFPSVQKGWLAENSFCVKWAFYGKRYRKSGDDPKDIHAHRFHKVLLYYIKKMRKPLAMDYRQLSSVDNHPITGYQFQITKKSSNRFRVRAVLNMHGYDLVRDEQVGMATPYTRTFEYYLNTDDNGSIVNGTWISTNPDFLWVPITQQDCGRENPHIKNAAIERIFQTLRVADQVVEENVFEFDEVVSREKIIELPVPHYPGAELKLETSSETTSMRARIYADTDGYYEPNVKTSSWSIYASNSLSFHGGEDSKTVKRMWVRVPHPGNRPKRFHFKIKRIEYLGKQ